MEEESTNTQMEISMRATSKMERGKERLLINGSKVKDTSVCGEMIEWRVKLNL